MNNLAKLKGQIQELEGLTAVEEAIKNKLTSDAYLLSEIGNYLLTLGGKRIRPILALLVAKVCGMDSNTKSLTAFSAGLELIHMATLLHDDIIDRSPLRRHKASPYIKYGSEPTLLCGDFLLTRAFSLCAHLDSFIIDATEKACVELTEGEILETPLHKNQHTLESALQIAEKKTASLFSLAAEGSAHLAGAPTASIGAFAQFGKNLGIAFQILDDILDVTSTQEQLGKMAGIDIHERKPSIVNIYWLESEDPKANILLTTPEEDEQKIIAELLKHLKTSTPILHSQALAKAYAVKADDLLGLAVSQLPSANPLAIGQLRALIEYVIDRSK